MNLASLIEQHARHRPDATAIIEGEETWTYRDLNRLVRQVTARLRAIGVVKDDVIAVLMHDTPLNLATIFAIGRLGAVVLPLDWRASMREINRRTERFKPKIVLADDAARAGPLMHHLDLAEITGLDPDDGGIVELKDQPFTQALTSGTTGEPKALISTHEQTFHRSLSNWVEYPVLRTDRVMSMLPLGYGAGTSQKMAVLFLGATLVMMSSYSAPAEVVDTVNKSGVDLLILPPNTIRGLLKLADERGDGLVMPNLRLLISSTDGLQRSERARVRERVAKAIVGNYGTTGTGPVCRLWEEDDIEGRSAVGRPVLGMQVEIVDPDGKPLGVDEVGDVRLRGPAVINQVIDDQPQSAEGFRDGWYYPGDLGSVGENGVVYLHGRTADLIKTGGLMVYSYEVERVLMEHPEVTEVAVVGTPHPELGQEVVAFVSLSGSVAPAALTVHCRKQLSAFKVPKQITIVETFPRNANGKIVKRELLAAE